MNPNPPPTDPATGQPHPDSFRPHTYDGIQEYDKRLPNWWLYTLYGAIVFSVIYWFIHITAAITPSDGARVDAAIAGINAAKMASAIDVSNDTALWEMSRNAVFVEAGKTTFNSLCAPCHLTSLRGKEENPAAVGPSLADTRWIHGGAPKVIYHTVEAGVLAKGMPAWGPVLGPKKTAEVVAYVLSHHKEGEPVEIETAK